MLKNNGVVLTTINICRQFNNGYSRFDALKDINIKIMENSLTVLKGRSGSGKTTLINILGALDSPTSGFVYYRDREISGLSQINKDKLHRYEFAFIFQAVVLIAMMTAYENIEFALMVAGYDKRLRKKRAEECLKMVGLSKRMHHMPHQLSGGEQQRVAIARAISANCPVLFADEPTAELDTHTGLKVMHLFREIIEKNGITAIVTSHDPNIVNIADYVYTLQDGEVLNDS